MNRQTKLGGTFTLPGASLNLYRMGYGAMQLAGPGVWGLPANITLSWTLPYHGTAKEWNAHSERSSWESGAIDLWVSLVPLVNPSELWSTIEATSSRPFEGWQGYANRNR